LRQASRTDWTARHGGTVAILLESEVDDAGNAWVHFRAPDGNIYEFTEDPGVTRPV
jgi:hypothetical protein